MTELDKSHLSDPETEESVLSTLMDGKVRIQSLWPEHFTNALRRRLYELLKEGVKYDDLAGVLRSEGILEEEMGYLVDVYQCPTLPRQEIPEAIDNLKRLAALRRLCEAVDTWRVRAPHLTVEKAVKGLRGALGGFEASLPPKSPPVLIGRGARGR